MHTPVSIPQDRLDRLHFAVGLMVVTLGLFLGAVAVQFLWLR